MLKRFTRPRVRPDQHVLALEPRVLMSASRHGGLRHWPPDGPLPLSAPIDVRPAAASTGTLSPLSAIPALNSDPGAPATLYLDFHGEPAQSWWGQTVPATPAYDIDGDPTTFSDTELANIQEIWSRVAEAFSPFNINVTTVDPAASGPGHEWNLTGGGNHHHQFRVVIGGDGAWTGAWTGATEGGSAYISSYYLTALPNTAYVFPANLSNGYPQYTADDTAHEAGHAFGLDHQSTYDGTTKTSEYNVGNGVTAPFMGNPLWPGSRATWWRGQSTVAYNVIQDDLAVLSGSADGFGYRVPSAGQSAAAAMPLAFSGNALATTGIIESTGQKDYYSVNISSYWTGTFAVNVAQYGPMLHAQLELHDASDNVIASADNAATLGQSLSADLSPGRYYLVVKSFGQYGDVGQYTLSGSLVPSAPKVVGRFAFYNNSAFDGFDPAAAASDDNAVAKDKRPLLPGQTASFANYTSYLRGINGIMVDLANPPGATLDAGDFSFLVGNSTDLTQWTAAAPPTVLARTHNGAVRVELIWPDRAIRDEWLQVTVNADANTGLAAPDVFYFGNLVGSSGATLQGNQFIVTAADEAAARNDLHGFMNPAAITDNQDFNRDGKVDVTDQLIARLNVSGPTLLQLAAPAPPVAVPLISSAAHAGVSPAIPPPPIPTPAPPGDGGAPDVWPPGMPRWAKRFWPTRRRPHPRPV